jgi:hypothetical protein
MLRFKLAATAALLVATFALTEMASAQTVAYRHRSTVFGDHAAGLSELVRAQGAFLRDEAAAAAKWVEVAAAEDQLWYQRAEYRYQVKQMQLEYLKQKAQANRERQELTAAADEAAALELLRSAQRGAARWPAALTLPKFAGSMSLVESLLKNWSPDDAAGDAYRAALATEAGVLRTRISNDTSIDFNNRVEAVKTLKRLQRLASMGGRTNIDGQGVAGEQLAAR